MCPEDVAIVYGFCGNLNAKDDCELAGYTRGYYPSSRASIVFDHGQFRDACPVNCKSILSLVTVRLWRTIQ